jgi:hypothetical protein
VGSRVEGFHAGMLFTGGYALLPGSFGNLFATEDTTGFFVILWVGLTGLMSICRL